MYKMFNIHDKNHSTGTCGINSISNFPVDGDLRLFSGSKFSLDEIKQKLINEIRDAVHLIQVNAADVDEHYNDEDEETIAVDCFLNGYQSFSMKALLALGFEYKGSWINLNTGNKIYAFIYTGFIGDIRGLNPNVSEVRNIQLPFL